MFKLSRPPGRFPQRDGVRRNELAVVHLTTTGYRLINANTLAALSQRLRDQSTDIRFSNARTRTSNEQPAHDRLLTRELEKLTTETRRTRRKPKKTEKEADEYR